MSEIDFAQCRKCTPSYRSLPKHYPKPVCSERSEVEASMLNDEWVSAPPFFYCPCTSRPRRRVIGFIGGACACA